MTRSQSKPRAKLLRSLYIWHRYLGLSAALFVFLLAVTGLALNHTQTLRLDSTHVQSNALLDWYGIHAPQIDTSFPAGAYRISQVGSDIYRDSARIFEQGTALVGAIVYSELLVVALQDRLLLFTPEGDLVEQLDAAAGVPPGLQALGADGDGKIVARAEQGYYTVDADFLEWRKVDRPAAEWVMSEKPPASLQQSLQTSWRGTGLSMERILLDLHSGRIFGRWGVYLMDAAAVLFMVLACTGIWLWGKRRASARQHARTSRRLKSK